MPESYQIVLRGGVDRQRDHRDQFLRFLVLDVRLDELVDRELRLLETDERLTTRRGIEVLVGQCTDPSTVALVAGRDERAVKDDADDRLGPAEIAFVRADELRHRRL